MSLFQAWRHRARISSYDLKTRLDSQLSRMNCQMFSTGFSSGALGGKGGSVMLGGTASLAVVCHPAWSAKRTAWALVLTWGEISSRCHCMAWGVAAGQDAGCAPTPRMRRARDSWRQRYRPTSSVGPGAPWAGFPVAPGARVILFFWPTRASSCHQSSISVVAGHAARIASNAAGTFFKTLDGQFVLRSVTRACGNLDEPQCLQLPAHGRLIQRDAAFLPYPLCEVLEAPAHHTMGRGDRPALDDPCKRSALRVVELGRRARCRAVNQPVRPRAIETQPPNPGSPERPTPLIRAASERAPPS